MGPNTFKRRSGSERIQNNKKCVVPYLQDNGDKQAHTKAVFQGGIPAEAYWSSADLSKQVQIEDLSYLHCCGS